MGGDHAAFDLKSSLKTQLENAGYEVIDVGTYSTASVDYPDYAHLLSDQVVAEQCKGILICGSGNGVCMSANKHKGIRAALCWTVEIAQLARQHNDANVLCLPARFVTAHQAMDMTMAFLTTNFEEGRHLTRVNKIDNQRA